MGIGDWGLGIGPNPQSPIPNPQSPIPILYIILYINKMKNIQIVRYLSFFIAIIIHLICIETINSFETEPDQSVFKHLLGNLVENTPINILLLSNLKKMKNVNTINSDKNSAKFDDLNDGRQDFNVTLDNTTYSINSTTNNTQCIPECYLNCKQHFPDPLEEKYCIINVCKCDLITNIPSSNTTGILMLVNSNNTNSGLDPLLQNYKLNEQVERHKYYILMFILLSIFIPLLIYLFYQMQKYSEQYKEINYEYPFNIGQYMLMGEYTENNN